MDFLTIVLAVLFSYTLIQTLLSLSGVGKPKNVPPGPTPLPIIGNLHLIGDKPHQSLTKLAKIHGPIMFLKFGRIPTLVISSVAAAREVLQKQDLAFSNRQIPDSVHARNMCQSSSIWLPVAAKWRNLRKIHRNHIFSVERLDYNQHLLAQKVQELVAVCRKSSQSCNSVDIGLLAFQTTSNLLSNTFFSKDLTDLNQDSAKDLKELIEKIVSDVAKPNLADFFPVLKMVDPQGIRRRMSNNFDKLYKIFDGLIDERLEMKKLRQHEENNDVLDMCLKISEENPEFDRAQLKVIFLDLFAAGTDTTTSIIEWAMAELLRNPQIMAKAKEELTQVIGKGKIVEVPDVSRLPYLQCIIKEALRIHPAAPFLIPRKVETNVEINGYTIPKGTQVLVNTWAIGRDPTLWEDSLEFKPERFLTSTLDVRGQDFELLPFGSGRRICPGMPLAMRLLPVTVGSLVNNFDWKLDGGIEPMQLDMTEKFGIVLEKAKPLCAVPMPLA